MTHIVYPFGPKGDVDDGVEYIRSLEKRCCTRDLLLLNYDGLVMHCQKQPQLHRVLNLCVCGRGTDVLVHYWYYPDSYDRCIPASVAPEAIETDKRIKGELS